MKALILSVVIALAFGSLTFCAQGQTLRMTQSHENGIYQCGDTYSFFAWYHRTDDSLKTEIRKNNELIAIQDKRTPDTIYTKSWWDNDSLIFEFKQPALEEKNGILAGTMTRPGSILVNSKVGGLQQSLGAIFDPEKIKTGTPFPNDFEAFWSEQKKALKSLPLDVKLNKMDVGEAGFECFDAELNCTDPKPARGYFAKPVNAKHQSLPIVLLVHAAGVKGLWCRSKTEDALRFAKMGKGALCFDLNAHGMLNGQPDEYYNQLEAGELKEYWKQGIENRETFYFRGMYLRLIRTLDFLEQQPEWDGKRILVIGESQGGGQALAAAGLDPHVSAVVATVPAMCDWGGALVGRKGGWPQPFAQNFNKDKLLKVVPYFDNANLLKYAKAEIVVEIGLIDQTCPSTSVYAAINQAKGKKIVYAVPYREHHEPPGAQHEEWVKTVYQPKMSFIEDYLK